MNTPKHEKVTNPETGWKITIGGATYNDLLPRYQLVENGDKKQLILNPDYEHNVICDKYPRLDDFRHTNSPSVGNSYHIQSRGGYNYSSQPHPSRYSPQYPVHQHPQPQYPVHQYHQPQYPVHQHKQMDNCGYETMPSYQYMDIMNAIEGVRSTVTKLTTAVNKMNRTIEKLERKAKPSPTALPAYPPTKRIQTPVDKDKSQPDIRAEESCTETRGIKTSPLLNSVSQPITDVSNVHIDQDMQKPDDSDNPRQLDIDMPELVGEKNFNELVRFFNTLITEVIQA